MKALELDEEQLFYSLLFFLSGTQKFAAFVFIFIIHLDFPQYLHFSFANTNFQDM